MKVIFIILFSWSIVSAFAADWRDHPLSCRFDGMDMFWCVRAYSSDTFAVSHIGKREKEWTVKPDTFIDDDPNIDAAINIPDFQMALDITKALNLGKKN